MGVLFDYLFKDGFIVDRLGVAGAKSFSSALLIFIPGFVSVLALILCKNKKDFTPSKLADLFGKGIKSIAPAVGVCVVGYMIGALFVDLRVDVEMRELIINTNMSKLGLVIVICVLTCLLGMVIPGSSLYQVK